MLNYDVFKQRTDKGLDSSIQKMYDEAFQPILAVSLVILLWLKNSLQPAFPTLKNVYTELRMKEYFYQ